jgi:prepilin-type N-terminal cleavage/methylation domain-containing protein
LDQRRGLTLIEVVASLLLLSSLLAGILVAYGRHARQVRRAQQRIQAVASADHMLADWFRASTRVPKASSGSVPGDKKLRWRTRPVNGTEPQTALDVEVVRLEILEDSEETEREETEPLVSIDLVAPVTDRSVETKEKE